MVKVGDVFKDILLEEKLRVTSVTDDEITLIGTIEGEEDTNVVMISDHLKHLLGKGYWKLDTPVPVKKKKKRKRRKKKKVETSK